MGVLNHMKKALCIILTFVFAVAALSLVGCNSGEKQAPKEITMTTAEMYSAVYAVSGFGTMTAVPQRDLTEIYAIDISKVAEYTWYSSENPSLNGDEVVIFKATDAEYSDVLVSVFEERIANQISVAEKYSPSEVAKLRQTQIVKNGCWVYYAVGDNYSSMMSVFGTIFGG